MENNKTLEEIFLCLEAAQDILKKFKGIHYNSADAASVNEAMMFLNAAKRIIEKINDIEEKKVNDINKTLEDTEEILKDLASQRSMVANEYQNK